MPKSVCDTCPECGNATFIIERNIGATVIRCSHCNYTLITLQMGRLSLHLYPRHKCNDIVINTYEYCDKPKSNRSKLKWSEKMNPEDEINEIWERIKALENKVLEMERRLHYGDRF